MKKFIILIPLFNDWQSVSRLLNKIDLEVKNLNISISEKNLAEMIKTSKNFQDEKKII